MDISVVLCTYNRAESLRRTLCSLSAMRVPANLRWEVLVVDNNSSDHTRDVTEMAGGHLPCRYLFEDRQGKSFALNTAIPQARGEIVAFTDDDVTIDQDWLTALWRAVTQLDCAGVGGCIRPVWNCLKPPWYSDSEPYRIMAGVVVDYDLGNVSQEISKPPFGANMAFRKDVFKKHGVFRTDLGPTGRRLMRGEDTEFCQRIIDSGENIVYVPDAIVYHPVDEKRLQKRYFQSWYYEYGRMIVRRDPPATETVRWFGVPRYILRELAGAALTWATAFEPKKRFFHKLECYQRFGQIAELRRGYQPILNSRADN
jgi:glycosyltransferase involved in cell wall biosynthesis